MKIKILKDVMLDLDGEYKIYKPSNKIYTIKDSVAKERNYVERYMNFPQYIEIVEIHTKEVKKKLEE